MSPSVESMNSVLSFSLFTVHCSLFTAHHSSGQPMLDQKLFQQVRVHRLGNDVRFVVLDLVRKYPVNFGLGVRRVEFDYGLAFSSAFAPCCPEARNGSSASRA